MEHTETPKCCCPAPITLPDEKDTFVFEKSSTQVQLSDELGTTDLEKKEYRCSCESPSQPKLSDIDLFLEGGNLADLMSLSKATQLKFMLSFDTILTDCDGVLWRSGKALPGAADVLNCLRQKGKQIYFLTNNSTKTRQEFMESATKFGFQGNANEFISTAHLAADYLESINFNKTVYIIGSPGLQRELSFLKIKSIGVGPGYHSSNVDKYLEEFKRNKNVGAVLVGFDPHYSFEKVLHASSYLTNPEVLFLATNTDERFPNDNTKIAIPGSGVMVSGVETCSGRKPDIIFGKPSEYVCKFIKKQYRFNPERTLMIGDRANTDILFGKRCGLKTLLVLSGITTLEESLKWKSSTDKKDQELVADFYVEKLGDLLPLVKEI